MENIFIKLYCAHHKEILENLVDGIEAMELLHTPLKLRYQTNPDDTLTEVDDLKKTFLQAYQSGQNSTCILHSNDKDADLVHLTLGISLDIYELMLKDFPPPLASHTIDIHLKLPQTSPYIETSYDILKTWTTLTNCFRAEAITSQESIIYAQQRNTFGQTNHQPPYNLPDLSESIKYVNNVLIPPRFAWINYWSKEAIDYLNWDESNADLFHKSEYTKNSGLMLQLTKPLLTMERQDHQDVLHNAYLAFPKVGGRYWVK